MKAHLEKGREESGVAGTREKNVASQSPPAPGIFPMNGEGRGGNQREAGSRN